MPTNFPAGTDTFSTKVDGVSDVLAADINNLQDSVVAIQNNVVKKAGDTMTGNLNIQNTAPTINLIDTDNITRSLHVNSNLMGFLKSDGNWDMYMNNSGQMWTASYGWLHSNFFSAVTNCGGSTNAINCYGSGNKVASVSAELMDDGGTVRIRSVNTLTNCDCAAGDCNCACGW